jgi:hypothetical protein
MTYKIGWKGRTKMCVNREIRVMYNVYAWIKGGAPNMIRVVFECLRTLELGYEMNVIYMRVEEKATSEMVELQRCRDGNH